MATVEGITIPVKLDSTGLLSGIKSSLNDVENFVVDIKKYIDTLNKETVFKMNTKELDKDIKEIEKELGKLSEHKQLIINTKFQNDDVKKQLKFIEERSKELQSKLDFRVSVKEGKGKSLKDIEKQIKDINKEIEKKKEIKVNNLSEKAFLETQKDIKKLEKELDELGKIRKIKIELDKKQLDNVKKTFSSLNKIAAGVAIGVGAITTALAATTKQAIDFEAQFAEVETLLSGMSAQGVEALKTEVIELSKETGILTNENIPALYQAISASVPTDNVIDFMRVASQNAIGGVTDLEISVDGLTTIINAYGMDVSEATNVSDMMFQTMKRGKTTIGELASSYFNVTSIAAALGVSFGNISAAMATITAQGVPTSVSTTYLRQMLVELGDEGKDVAKTFKQLSGQTFREFIASGNSLQDALKLLEAEAKRNDVTLNNLFGSVEAGNAALALTGDNTKRFTSDLEAMEKSAGATAEAFKKIDESPAQRIKKIQASLQAVTLEIGRSLIPVAEKMIKLIEDNKDGITNFIKSIANFFVSIAQHGRLVVSIIGTLTGGFIGLNVALAITAPASFSVAAGIKATAASFIALNAATGGLVLALGAIAGALALLLINTDIVIEGFERLSAAVGVAEAKINQLEKQAKKQADSYKQMKSEIAGSSAEADKLIATYDRLSKKQNRTAEENKKLKESLEEIKNLIPQVGDALEKGIALEDIETSKFFTVDESSIIEEAKKTALAYDDAYQKAYADVQKKKSKLEPANLKKDINIYGLGIEAKYKDDLIKAEEHLKQITEERSKAFKEQDNLQNIALKRKNREVEQSNELLDINKEIEKLYKQTQSTTTEKDPIEELNKKYKYEKELLNKRKMDEEEKNKALEELDKNYYTNLLNVATDTYVNLNKKGKNRTQSEKENLNKLVGYTNEATKKLKELNKKEETEDPIKKLEAEYKARKELINNTVEDEKEKKNLLLQNEINFNSQKLQLLEQNAQAIYALSDEERAKRQEDLAKLEEDIKETRATLDNLNDTPKMTIAEAFAQEWQNIVGMAQNAVNSIANIWSTMWSNNLQVVEDTLNEQLDLIDKTLNEELEAIDKKHEKEQEMYDNRIKDIEDREKEREKIITETEEAIADINEEIGEHTTEENYNRLIEQREALEEKLKAEQEALIADEQMRSQLEEEKRIKEEQTEIQKDEAEKRAKEKREEEEKKAAIKKAEIQRKQAIMDKATGIFNATVALASGIASAAAAGAATGIAAPIMIPLFVSLVVASAAGQIAAIAATPLPEIPSFAEGGYVPNSNELQFKHIVGSPPNKKDKTLVWASKGERILNHDETKQWEFIKSQELKYITNNNMKNNNPVININNTVNAGNTKDANKLAKLSGKAIAKEVVTAITRGYN